MASERDQQSGSVGGGVGEFAGVTFEPESPFLSEPSDAQEGGPEGRNVSALLSVEAPTAYGLLESPFITQYSLEEAPVESMDASFYRDILSDLYEEGFAEAVTDLVNELAALAEDRFVAEHPDPAAQRAEIERYLESYLAPLEREAVALLDNMAQELSQHDLYSMTEMQLDEVLDRFEPATQLESPVFEEFLKKIWGKAKAAVKKAVSTASQVVRKVGSVLPHNILLNKIKGLVRPLLRRVLRFAINKLPANFRPLAQQVARRFLGETRDELVMSEEFSFLEEAPVLSEARAEDSEATVLTPEMLADEFDALLAGYMTEGEDFERDPAVASYLLGEEPPGAEVQAQLEQARDEFSRQISQLPAGADPTPQVQEFVAAILPALRIAIRIIGRQRVVDFLAGLVANLIKGFVGQQAAPALSKALVDTGLKLISLETADDPRAVGDVLAATVEETVERLVQEAPEQAFEDEGVLAAYVQEAFEAAVASNFPPTLVRPELRKAPHSMGMWVLMPRRRGPKRYKKYTRVFEVTVTPQMAAQITTFGGQTLRSFLVDQLGLPADKQDIKAKVHLYENIRGTTLSRISFHERNAPGLGSHRRHAWMQLHPLTPEAAGLLIPRDVGLSVRVPDRFLVTRNMVQVGQRFYFLEIPGAKVVMRPTPAAPARRAAAPGGVVTPVPAPSAAATIARPSQLNVTLDFRARRIQVFEFLSDADSQSIAQKLRTSAPASAIMTALKVHLRIGLETILSGRPSRALRIVREVPSEQALPVGVVAALRWVGQKLAKMLLQFIVNQFLKYLQNRAREFAAVFIAAADDPSDGVTVIFTAEVGEVFDLLTAPLARRAAILAGLLKSGLRGVLSVDVKPGFVGR